MAWNRFSGVAAAATALALTAARGGPSGQGGGDAGEAATIGVFLPLTGENAENGQQIKNAIEMYVDAYNADDHKYKINLVIRDDRGEPKTATNIAREFSQDEKIVAAVGSLTSTAAMAAAPILDNAGIPQLSPTSSHPDFTGLGKFVFRGTPTQDKEAALIAQHLKDELGEDTASVVYRQDDWGNSAAEHFQMGYGEAGGTVASSEAVAPDSRDFRTLVTAMKSTNTAAAYLALQYSDAAVIAQQMKASAWDPTVVTATSLYTHELIELAGRDAVEGWHVPAFFFAESTEPVVKEFVDGYRDRFGEEPTAHAASGYDSIAMIGAALDTIEEAGEAGRTPLGEALFTVSLTGATGEMKFDENGDVEKEITWLVVNDGEFVPQS